MSRSLEVGCILLVIVFLLFCIFPLMQQPVKATERMRYFVVSESNGFGQPNAVAISPDGVYAYVACSDGNIRVINTATNTVTAVIFVGSIISLPFGGSIVMAPSDLAVTPNGQYLYVTNNQNDSVSVINTATNAVTAVINFGTYSWGTPYYPTGVAVSPNGEYVYVTQMGPSDSVAVINTSAVLND